MTREVMASMTSWRHKVRMTIAAAPSASTPFGLRLREWRRSRRLTQEALAADARTSPRHLSCMEGGKAMPSEVMVLRLSEALAVPLRERNALLAAAGFAPRYAAHRGEPIPAALEPIVQQLIEAQPHPAYALDAGFDVVAANAAATALMRLFVPDGTMNVARFLTLPHLRDVVVNWDETVRTFLARLRNDCAAQGPRSPLTALLDELERDPHVAAALRRSPPPPVEPVQTLVLRTPAGETRWLTLLMSFGAPQDAMVEQLVIEQLLPADDATRAFVASL